MLGIVLFVDQLQAQTRIITGKITDGSGNPVPNATILIKGSRSGTASSADGTYSLTIPPNAKTIVISAIGMGESEYNIGNKGIINASLRTDDKNLQEVVVVGYGTQKRKELTGSVASISGATVAEKPVQSFENALAGKAAGVQITMPNGVVNNPPVFRIRGTNSISLSSYPLVVVDGVPTYTGDLGSTSAPANALASINPNDIESIDIAKDAAATAIYGSRAANGVVFVTTKKGKAGRARVSYDGWVGWVSPNRLPDMMDGFQYTDYKKVALANAVANNPALSTAAKPSSINLTNGPDGKPINTNWFDYVYHTGFSHSHNINVSGGNEGTTYYFSSGYTKQEGVLQKNAFERKNILLNVNSRVNNIISIGGKLSYSNERNLIAGSSGGLNGEGFNIANAAREAIVLPPNISPYNNDGTYNLASGTAIGSMGNIISGSNPISYYNIVQIMDKNRSNNETNHLQTNVYLQIKPFSWMTLKTTYGIDNLLIDNDVFQNPFHGDGASGSTGGSATASFLKNKTWLWTNTAQFDYTFAKKHNFSLLVGNEQQRRTNNQFGLNRTGLSDSAYTVIQAGFTTTNSASASLGQNYLLSSFGRLSYNFNKKYFLTGNIRQDEYSALGKKKGVFYGASAGWELTQEKFWESTQLNKVFSSMRLRGSYGKVGNIGGIGDFATFSNYTSSLYGGIATLGYNSAGNTQITWETSTKTDAGISFGLFNDRFTADLGYYKNDINNMLLSVPQSPSAGLPSNILQNVGSMYNKGIEISLNGSPVITKDFSWNSSFTYSHNVNKVTSLALGIKELVNGLGGGTTELVTKTVPGYSIGQIWVVRSQGVDAGTGRRIFLNAANQPIYYEYGTLPAGKFNWSNADGTQYLKNGSAAAINQSDDGVLYANTQPKFYGGWDNTFRYKNFDVNVLLTYQAGNYLYYGTNAGLHDQRFWNNTKDVLNYWAKPGDVTNIPKPIYNDNTSNGSAFPLDINVFKGDYIKLRTLQIGYNLPKVILDRVKISRFRVYASGQNLAIITKYPGPDPEVSTDGNSSNANGTQGVDRNTLANGRSITVGLNVSF